MHLSTCSAAIAVGQPNNITRKQTSKIATQQLITPNTTITTEQYNNNSRTNNRTKTI